MFLKKVCLIARELKNWGDLRYKLQVKDQT